jgi:HAD superfamily hydrolase (TIGR01549 family)
LITSCGIDLGHTLVNDTKFTLIAIHETVQWLQRHGRLHSEEPFVSTYLRINRFCRKPFVSHTYGELEFFERTFEELNLDHDSVSAQQALEIYRRVLMKRMEIEPEVVEALQCLKERGLRLALVSNERVQRVDAFFKKFELESLFETVVVSEAIRSEKPNLGIFQETLRRLKINGNEMVMFGDSEVADGACRELGIEFVLVTEYIPPHRQEWKRNSQPPDYVMARLTRYTIEKFLDLRFDRQP